MYQDFLYTLNWNVSGLCPTGDARPAEEGDQKQEGPYQKYHHVGQVCICLPLYLSIYLSIYLAI